MLKRNIIFLFLTLLIGFAILYFFHTPLGIIFAILWLDKVLLGAISPLRYIGIEFTTIATILLGLLVGPIFGFLFCIVLIPVLHGLKYLFLPLPEPEWPLFVPAPYNFVDALGALVAGLLVGNPLLFILIAVLIAKDISYVIIDRFIFSKPPDFLSAGGNLIFNLVIVTQLGPIFLNMVGV